MSPRPAVVTGLAAEPALVAISLTWDSLGFDPLIDHYRIYGLRGGTAPDTADEAALLGKTVYPRFRHTGLDVAGETWTYAVLAVSDAGERGEPSAPVSAASDPSVTATGTPVATIGDFDGRTLEHLLAPASYAQIPERFPDALIEYVDGTDAPGEAWPYLLPGPGDAWAGSKPYRARWTVTLESSPSEDHDLALWLVDTTRLGGLLRIAANGEHITDLELPVGATRGSREGDATVPGTPLRRALLELPVPAAALQEGQNVIELELAEGGWVAWDALGLFARG
ncbi:hypothetical protein HMPREF3159_09180 [Brachybacterium sp. HMSC06H03]|uniref:polysaccharide lyase family protein n=1 Tax=Brachybacterium sp. HMSC06H03 TaxID=1581127 RepID=UPI0008A1E428|nr:polysaccharide lyase family protein [Brachybacterium sp. HMSC06H03]OFT56421.1 hypothetical protein HMPREF3159_09180 [Brachybacterium sp. HMSC06H03]